MYALASSLKHKCSFVNMGKGRKSKRLKKLLASLLESSDSSSSSSSDDWEDAMLFLIAGAMQTSGSSVSSTDAPVLNVTSSTSSQTVAVLQTRPTDFQAVFMAAFENWVVSCNLHQWININLNQLCAEGCILKVPLVGLPASPELDVSLHGRQYSGLVFHGTSFSYLPSICSAGCLLRCSIPTRGKHAIWVGESFSRALLYASPVELGGKQVQCVVGIQAKRIKGSHFRSHDKQLILRECWGQLQWLMVKEYNGEQLYKPTFKSHS
jgi:hypothetical protein